jgi:DNA-binding transcriptional ArsR family regulator
VATTGPDLTKVFKALGNRRRRAVFQVIWRAGSGERAHGKRDAQGGCTVGAIATKTGMPQPSVSLYLQRLSEAGLVTTTRTHRSVVCTVNPDALAAIAAWARDPGRERL